MLYCIGVKVVMHYLDNNLSGVIIITRVYVTMTEFHENMKTLDDIKKNVLLLSFQCIVISSVALFIFLTFIACIRCE